MASGVREQFVDDDPDPLGASGLEFERVRRDLRWHGRGVAFGCWGETGNLRLVNIAREIARSFNRRTSSNRPTADQLNRRRRDPQRATGEWLSYAANPSAGPSS